MKVVHIGFKYGQRNTGGAAIAATRLHQALLAHGVESHYICIWQCEDGVNVHELPRRGRFARVFFLFFTKCLRVAWKCSSYKRSIPMNLIPLYGLEKEIFAIKPDVIHIHWITADVVSYHQLKLVYKRLRGKGVPVNIIVNLHDLYLLNVFDPHPNRDMRYVKGFNRNNSTFFERFIFYRKKRLIDDLRPAFIGPSEWVCMCCKESIIGKQYNVYDVPNIIPEEFYYDATCLRTNEKVVLLFGAYGGRANLYKGFQDLETALSMLPSKIKERCELRVFGEEAQDVVLQGISVKFLGIVNEVWALRRVYNEADVFLFPSVEETQGMTKIEAMLCGLPVITFDRTACAEGVVHLVNGWIADDGDITAFAKGIAYYATNCVNREAISKVARAHYGYNSIIEKILRVYSSGAAIAEL